jgi:hypothetical protein
LVKPEGIAGGEEAPTRKGQRVDCRRGEAFTQSELAEPAGFEVQAAEGLTGYPQTVILEQEGMDIARELGWLKQHRVLALEIKAPEASALVEDLRSQVRGGITRGSGAFIHRKD